MAKTKQPVLRDSEGRFVKGESGNPGGRPNALKRYAQELGEESIDGLIGIARDENNPAGVRVQAYNAVLDRGYGKPGQSVDMTTDGKPIAMPAPIIFAEVPGLPPEPPTDGDE